MTGQLTTHALDLVLGHGAAGLTVWVKRLSPNPLEIGEVELDGGGRAALASGEAFEAGMYELTFRIGDYHRGRGLVDGEAFLEEAPVRFRVKDAALHTHIPLLISLYGYSIYRGG